MIHDGHVSFSSVMLWFPRAVVKISEGSALGDALFGRCHRANKAFSVFKFFCYHFCAQPSAELAQLVEQLICNQ